MADSKRRLKIFLVLFILLTLLGSLGFMKLEKISFTQAFYYNIVTMSTVGYGDIHPTTPQSQLFAVFLIIMGGTTFLGVIANATELLRPELESLPGADLRHLSGDFNRTYQRLAIQWLDYLEHLKEQYPYLFSLAARKNPFNPDASILVLE